MMWRRPSSHSQVVLAGWDSLSQTICDETKQVVVDGESLRLSKVVAVARSENPFLASPLSFLQNPSSLIGRFHHLADTQGPSLPISKVRFHESAWADVCFLPKASATGPWFG